MTKIACIERNFASATLAVIEQANAIIEDYSAQGFVHTLTYSRVEGRCRTDPCHWTEITADE